MPSEKITTLSGIRVVDEPPPHRFDPSIDSMPWPWAPLCSLFTLFNPVLCKSKVMVISFLFYGSTSNYLYDRYRAVADRPVFLC
jgi:hypothetical protein